MPRLALSMIVRNEAGSLRRCIESVRGAAHEIVVADTGSTDATPAIARECGARVIEIPWTNDFAAARNLAMQGLASDWVLSLDADEVLDPAAREALPALLSAAGVAGYQVPIRNYVLSLQDRIWDRPARPNDLRLPAARGYAAFVDHENVRLFRRDARVFFTGRVHESVGPSIEQAGLGLGRALFLIHHFGLAADAETRARKNRLYRELGLQKVQDMPANAQAHLELGLVELDNFGHLEEARACFERACRLNPRLGVAWFFAGVTHLRREEPGEALRCLRQAEECGHATQAVAEAAGDAHYNRGEFSAAAKSYSEALQRAGQTAPLSLESKRGLALARAGSPEEGLRVVRQALERGPGRGELHDRLVQLLAWLQRGGEAALAAENKLRQVPGAAASDFLRAARLWTGEGHWARATAILHVGRQMHPGDPLLEEALAGLAEREGAGVNQLVTTLENRGTGAAQD
jgi:tetratricopeptide (TPR) repeat protein